MSHQDGVYRMLTFGVDELYTKQTIDAGNRVKNQLNSKLSDVSFEFQGSVMTNTHIKGYSDIDLLTITEKFYTFDREGINKSLNQTDVYFKYNQNQINTLKNVLNGGGYTNALTDLRELRLDCEETLDSVYSYVDTSRPKSIEVELTNPNRKVDVVIASWFQDTNYYINSNIVNKAIQVFYKGNIPAYDRKLDADYPFMRIKLLNDKDSIVNGRLKRMIRFLKTLKSDADQDIKLSSFDINAILFDIDTKQYHNKSYLELVPIAYEQLKKIANNYSYRYNLQSLDKREYIFRKDDRITEDVEKTGFLKILISEVEYIINELNSLKRLIA
ncbi:nucleotidyltransferase domain-containing protein [Plebeiibacterium marinum]|uniref:Nucleotidyltransferase domain-containing protein n=1 Tax=Plebeiibacterium marinum TaxID=2992111 RepID=A0AAE3MIH5_9BACT|nr:nucleotidyltransferase domain-containing protein [Plebeiobacterium marinum]MCW3808066.1 nucleotidyltransferase domain-containing protein [Plebeiobacterium marinum]